MSDYNSSLPIRTENAGDAIVKVADATLPSQQLTVNADGSVNITDNGSSLTVDATDLDIRDLSSAQDSVEVLQATHDNLNLNANLQVGDADVANGNPVPISDAGGSLTVDATDLDIRDLTHVSDSVKIGDGTDFLSVNSDGSINVVPLEDPGTERVNYNTSSALAAAASSNHDFAFTNASKLYQVLATASGKLKVEVQIETGSATNTFNTVMVGFNSTATPNISLTLSKYAAIPAGARVRVIRTNKDNQSQDVYSTIVGLES